MSKDTRFITKGLFHVLRILDLMKQPDGTTIEEICKELKVTRRSAFRLLKTIETKLNKPFITRRMTFGGTASYHLSQDFTEKMSNITLPELHLSFTQAILLHLILNENHFRSSENISNEIVDMEELFLSKPTITNDSK